MNNEEFIKDIKVEEKNEKWSIGELRANDWLCISCNNLVTSDKERFEFNNQTEFQFNNSCGYQFDIVTFKSAFGCVDSGKPTMEFTWFPDHSWSYAFCSRCHSQLGWKYKGKYSFYGLIKSQLIKGAALLN